MSATNRALLMLDLLKGAVAVVAGNIALPPLVLFLVGTFRPAHQTAVPTGQILLTVVCLIIAGYCFHKTVSKIIRFLVVICIFIPVILMLLSYFAILTVPLPF